MDYFDTNIMDDGSIFDGMNMNRPRQQEPDEDFDPFGMDTKVAASVGNTNAA